MIWSGLQVFFVIILISMQGSKFYENELKREQQVNQRIEKMMLQKEQITEQQLKRAQIQVKRVKSTGCFHTSILLNSLCIVWICVLGGGEGCRAGKEPWFNTCDCTCGHGRFLCCCGDERLSWAEGQAHGSGMYEHAGQFQSSNRSFLFHVLDELIVQII